MVEALWTVLVLIAVAITAIVVFPFVATRIEVQKKTNPQGVVKHDWLPTGRIDFATRLEDVNNQNKDKTGEFKLLGEERRIVESIAGNENLEIQWRLATLSEAKAVVTQYPKYLSENSLIKSIPDLAASSSPPSAQPQLSVVASTNDGSRAASESS
jgi:hypothetical protein